jgi:hypothetical protein
MVENTITRKALVAVFMNFLVGYLKGRFGELKYVSVTAVG